MQKDASAMGVSALSHGTKVSQTEHRAYCVYYEALAVGIGYD